MELEIDCGFNTNDETINFGNRGIADNDPHESVTFATLKTSTNYSGAPLILSTLNGEQLFSSVDNILAVFHEEEFGSLKFSCQLDHIIDYFFYCSESKLLLLFLRDGTLQIFKDILETFDFISYVSVVQKESTKNEKLFVTIHFLQYEHGKTSLLAVTSIGQILRVNIVEGNTSEISTSSELIQVIEGVINVSTYFNEMLFLHGSKMWVVDLSSGDLISSNALDLKCATFEGKMVLSLLNSGELVYICPVTLLHYVRNTDLVLDSIEVINNEKGLVKYINAVSKKNSDGRAHLYSFRSDFSIVYTLTIAHDVILTSSSTEVDEARYISWLQKNDGTIELRFQCVIETDPQKRLKRLLRRNMFDEAEKFARNQNLDLNIVSREKAKVLAEKCRITTKDIETLISIFHTLDDHSFILDCCMTVENACEKLDDLERILQYACNLQVSKKDETARKKHYYCNQSLIAFKLFRLIGEKEMDNWKFFNYENLVDEVKKLLKKQKLFQAMIVYNHMSHTEIENMDEKCVQGLLDILSEIDLYDVQSIMPRFIAITLEWLPSSLPLFIDWLERKIFVMEQLHAEDFPENAIEFLQVNSEYLMLKNSNLNAVEVNKNDPGEKIRTLSKILTKLSILKSQYNVRIPLNEMKQEPEIVVRTLLNLDLPKDVYNSILQQFTYKYILEDELNPDDLFYDALIDILKYQESYWSTIIGSVLSCITSQDLKLKAVENMFTRAKLPWSETIKEIGIQILKECYPKSGNVQQLIADEPRMMVMSRLEYGFDVNNSCNIDDLQFLVKRIIRCNLPTMISDTFILCEDKENYKIDAMRLLLHHFIEKGDFENVFILLEQSEAVVKKGLEQILASANNISKILTPSEAQNYAHFLNSNKVIEKYGSLCENEFELFIWKKRANSFLIANTIRNNFQVNITGLNILNPKQKKNLINEIRTTILEDYESGKKNVMGMMELLKVLASDMGFAIEKLYARCWKDVKIRKQEFLCNVAEEFLERPVKVKYICILVVYLLRNLANDDEFILTENSFIDSFNVDVSNTYSSRFLELSSLLISKAIWNADTEQLSPCLKIVPWVDVVYFLNKYKEQQKNSEPVEDKLDVKKLIPSFTSRVAIQKVFTVYTSYIAQFRNINYKYLSYYNRGEEPLTQDALLNQIREFESALFVLNQEGESLLAYKLLTTMQNCLSFHEDFDVRINNVLEDMIRKHLIPNLVQQSIHVGHIDKNLIHTSLMWCNSSELEKQIVRTFQFNRKDLQKVTTISEIAVKLFSYHEKTDLSLYFKNVLLNVSWWNKIKPSIIEYGLFFKVSDEERLKLMIQSEELNIDQIKEYCQEYNVADVQTFYLLHLKMYLLHWKPRYEIEISNIGRRKLIIKGNQPKELCQRCNSILSYIDNKEKVERMLQEIWAQVNFYYYEVFACILDIYKDNSFKHLKLMLGFLETYQRINKPSEMEVEKWFNTFQDSRVIEPLSEFRILFNNTLLESKDIWNIICKEISLENYTKWFEAVQAFSFLNVDNICSFLVKELVAEGKLKVIKPGDWVFAKHKHLFKEIDNCLDYMKDDVKKITVAYFLLSNTPEGADQVAIAKIVYKYAKEYKMRRGDSSQVSISKIEKKYQRCLSLQVLHKYDLAEKRYIDMIVHIEKLLLALYHDERIIKKINNIYQYCPDINTAVEKLANVFEFKLEQFLKKLVENFLMDSINLSDFSGDITIDHLLKLNSNEKTEKEKSENNIIRAAYICSRDVFYWHQIMWNEEYKSAKLDFYRARCVKCMLMFTDRIAIKALCSQSYESVLDILDELTLSSILSKFGLKIKLHDMNTWTTVTKKLALIGSKESVLALAQVCKILKLKKLKYWAYIIEKMDRYKMYWDMVEFLEYIKTEDYIYEKFYLDAWINLIDFIVNEILKSSETEMEDRIFNDLVIIQHCPVIFLLNLETVIKKCIELKRPKVAEVLLEYFPK